MEAVQTQVTWHGLEELREALMCFLSRHCIDSSEADDVVQETFVRAARYRATQSDSGRLKSWTMRIAMNVLSDRRRRASRLVSASESDGVEVTGAAALAEQADPSVFIGRFELDRGDAVQLMTRVMREMRDDDQRVLSSFYGGSQTCRETSADCDIPAHLVKVRLFRARQRLCRAMRHRLALERRALETGEAEETNEDVAEQVELRDARRRA